MHNENINSRVAKLRAYMQERGLSAFIIPTTDPHMSEYTPQHWQTRAWITGFDGSAGTAVVTLNKAAAALWTDSRYFIAAASALEGTPYELMKQGTDGTPGIGEWLAATLESGGTAGVDGTVVTQAFCDELAAVLMPKGITLDLTHDPFAEIYPDRPALPDNPVTVHPLEYAGETAASKIERILAKAAKKGCRSVFVSALDDIAWTLNLRGSDVPCNPVFVSYLLLAPGGSTLFANDTKLSPAVRQHLADAGVAVKPYGTAAAVLAANKAAPVLLSDKCNSTLQTAAACNGCVIAPSIPEKLKAVKNAAEISGFRRAMERDGAAMVTFLSRLDELVATGTLTETGVDRELTALRAAQPLYRGLSFATIAAYGAHAAIVHYEADEESDVKLEPKGMILIDSGAQYEDGTTDITRTIALGPVSDEERQAYTLTLKGHIMLSRCVFPDGASGTQIDCCARYHMWQNLMNYGHGTGHGAGCRLNVHEGPFHISPRATKTGELGLQAGILVSDEPGLYRPGHRGVRIENLIVARRAASTEFGEFLTFDLRTVDVSLLTPDEVAWLDDYHGKVLTALQNEALSTRAQAWLKARTAPAFRSRNIV